MQKHAQFSSCRKYRYSLSRVWNEEKPMVMFIGLNPSTANENVDDATIRRVIRFANDFGYGGVFMCNCFPFVSTDPNALYDFGTTDIHDKENAINNEWLIKISSLCKDIFFAWGSFQVVNDLKRNVELTKMFPNALCLIKNKDGSPRHPLYVPKSITPIKFNV